MIPQAITALLIAGSTFTGQQVGKQKEWERHLVERQIEMAQKLCEEKNLCGPAIQWATPFNRPPLPSVIKLPAGPGIIPTDIPLP